MADLVGPLQYQVCEPEMTDWQNIDWTALGNHSHVTEGMSWGVEDNLYDFGAYNVSANFDSKTEVGEFLCLPNDANVC